MTDIRTGDQPTTIRVFISSPGDVAEERERARQVIDQLRSRYAGVLDLQPVLWEDLPLQADASFQEAIDLVLSQRGVDLAVFVLWSRLGSPLGAGIARPDGSTYRSGTERELDLMLQARAQTDGERPDILVYVRDDEAGFEERLRGRSDDDKRQLLDQKQLLKGFVKESFFDADGGHNVRAYHSFPDPSRFSQRLRVHLQEILDQRGDRTASQAVWDTTIKGPPFRGLEAFHPEHAAIFCGREDEILEVRRALVAQARNGCAFVLLSGASGSGKSSLALAGVVPHVIACETDDQIPVWRHARLNPGGCAQDLLQGLAEALIADGALPELGSAAELDDITASLREHPASLYRLRMRQSLEQATGTRGGSARLLLVIDQLEELFTDPGIDEDERRHFVAALDALARSGGVWVLATMRSDFYHRCHSLPVLMAMKGTGGQVDVLPPQAAAIHRLITEPARLAGLGWEQRDGRSLADVITAEASDHPELLPLLGYLLLQLYDARDADGKLTFTAYESLATAPDGRRVGGLHGALAKRAEQTCAQTTDACFHTVLGELVTLGGADEAAVRRHPPRGRFARDPDALALVDALIDARLCISSKATDATSAPDGIVVIAHEALLRVWPRARAWVATHRDFLRTRARIDQRMLQGGVLLPGDPLLAQAEACLADRPEDLTAEARAFITDAVDQAQRARKRQRLIRRMALAVLVVLVAVAGIGLFSAAAAQADVARSALRHAVESEEQAARITEAYVELQDQRVFTDLEMARLYHANGDSRPALAHLARAIDQDPENPIGSKAMAMSLANERAFRLFSRSIGNSSDPYTVAAAPAGDRLAVATGGTIHLLHGRDGTALATASNGAVPLSSPPVFSPDGRWIYCGDVSGLVHRWDAYDGGKDRSYSGVIGAVGHVALSWDSKYVAFAASAGGNLVLAVTADGSMRYIPRQGTNPFAFVADQLYVLADTGADSAVADQLYVLADTGADSAVSANGFTCISPAGEQSFHEVIPNRQSPTAERIYRAPAKALTTIGQWLVAHTDAGMWLHDTSGKLELDTVPIAETAMPGSLGWGIGTFCLDDDALTIWHAPDGQQNFFHYRQTDIAGRPWTSCAVTLDRTRIYGIDEHGTLTCLALHTADDHITTIPLPKDLRTALAEPSVDHGGYRAANVRIYRQRGTDHVLVPSDMLTSNPPSYALANDYSTLRPLGDWPHDILASRSVVWKTRTWDPAWTAWRSVGQAETEGLFQARISAFDWSGNTGVVVTESDAAYACTTTVTLDDTDMVVPAAAWIRWGPKDATVLIGGTDKHITVCTIDGASLHVHKKLTLPHAVDAACISRDLRRLVTMTLGSQGTTIQLYDVASGAARGSAQTLVGKYVYGLFNHSGDGFLLTDGTTMTYVRCSDAGVLTGPIALSPRRYEATTFPHGGVEFSPDDQALLSADQTWDLAKGSSADADHWHKWALDLDWLDYQSDIEARLSASNAGILAWEERHGDQGGGLLIQADGACQFYDAYNRVVTPIDNKYLARVGKDAWMAYAAGDTALVTCDESQTVRCWNTDGVTPIGTPVVLPGAFTDDLITLDHSHTWLATVHDAQTVHLWNMETGHAVGAACRLDHAIVDLVFTPAAERLLILTTDDVVVINLVLDSWPDNGLAMVRARCNARFESEPTTAPLPLDMTRSLDHGVARSIDPFAIETDGRGAQDLEDVWKNAIKDTLATADLLTRLQAPLAAHSVLVELAKRMDDSPSFQTADGVDSARSSVRTAIEKLGIVVASTTPQTESVERQWAERVVEAIATPWPEVAVVAASQGSPPQQPNRPLGLFTQMRSGSDFRIKTTDPYAMMQLPRSPSGGLSWIDPHRCTVTITATATGHEGKIMWDDRYSAGWATFTADTDGQIRSFALPNRRLLWIRRDGRWHLD